MEQRRGSGASSSHQGTTQLNEHRGEDQEREQPEDDERDATESSRIWALPAFRKELKKLYERGYDLAATDEKHNDGKDLPPWVRPLATEINTCIENHYKDPPSTRLPTGAPTDTKCHLKDVAVPFVISGVGTCWRLALENTRPIYNNTMMLDKKD
eukprot:4380342-Heterocapsa_arctica.AAC.1